MEKEKASTHEENAMRLYHGGYNCAQAVFAAFCDVMHMDEVLALRISAGLGGGVARQREVCGAVLGMTMAAGVLFARVDTGSLAEKTENYARTRRLCDRFRAQNGSIVCRTLLGGSPDASPVPSARTDDFYEKRPCGAYIRAAVHILDGELAELNISV